MIIAVQFLERGCAHARIRASRFDVLRRISNRDGEFIGVRVIKLTVAAAEVPRRLTAFSLPDIAVFISELDISVIEDCVVICNLVESTFSVRKQTFDDERIGVEKRNVPPVARKVTAKYTINSPAFKILDLCVQRATYFLPCNFSSFFLLFLTIYCDVVTLEFTSLFISRRNPLGCSRKVLDGKA